MHIRHLSIIKMDYLLLYKKRMESSTAYKEYLRYLRYWVQQEQSWIVALSADDEFLLASLIRHLEEGDIQIFRQKNNISHEVVSDLWRLKYIGVTFERMLKVMHEHRSWRCFSVLMYDDGFSFWLYTQIDVNHIEDISIQSITLAVHSPVIADMIIHIYHRETFAIYPEQWRYNFIRDVFSIVYTELGAEGTRKILDILVSNRIYIDDPTMDRILKDSHGESIPLMIQYSMIWK